MQMGRLFEDSSALINILSQCERIRNTPMPQSHNYLLKVYIFVYTLIMPLGFVGVLGWWTVLAVCFIYFLAMGIVIIAEEIEEPFGNDRNDLPLDAITKGIFNNLKEFSKHDFEA